MTSSERNDHWLWRLDARAWLRAAEIELEAGAANLRSRRTAITHARRGAGMALNAVLVALAVPPHEELRWGRSYIDHLHAIAGADDPRRQPMSAQARTIAARLLTIAVAPTAALVQIGRGPDSAPQEALKLARALHDECAEAVARLDPPA